MPTISVNNQVSPRVVTVAAPDVEITIQELVDLLRAWEESPENMDDPQIISAAGKEALGGSVFVGITATLLDAVLEFEARYTKLDTAVVTTGDVNGQSLTDSGSDFVTPDVSRGDLIVNVTDGSYATVVARVSGTQLTTTQLIGGGDNQYDISDAIDIFDVVQCNVSGGNLVAVDNVGSDIDPILPSFGTQVVRTSSSSATLQELQDIQYASFNGGVWVDLGNITGNAASGTTFPSGTERQPVDNMADALSIAQTRGFLAFYILGDATVDSSHDYTGYRIIGQGQNLSTITLSAGATFADFAIRNATVTGTLDGEAHVEDCIIDSLTYLSGVIENCILTTNTITLGGGATAHFINCASGVPGLGTPTINMGGSGQALALRNYNGGITLENKTGSDAVSIDLNSGQVVLAATVTAGTVVCRGVGNLTDNSAGATVVNRMLDASDLQLARKLLSNKAVITSDGLSTTIYDDDGVTVLHQFTHTTDKLTRTPV